MTKTNPPKCFIFGSEEAGNRYFPKLIRTLSRANSELTIEHNTQSDMLKMFDVIKSGFRRYKYEESMFIVCIDKQVSEYYENYVELVELAQKLQLKIAVIFLSGTAQQFIDNPIVTNFLILTDIWDPEYPQELNSKVSKIFSPWEVKT